MQRHTDGLRRRSGDKHRQPVQFDPRADQVLEMGELGVDQLLDRHAFPFVLDEQVLGRSQRLDPLLEAADEFLRVRCQRLPRHRQHDRENVLGAVVHLVHQQLDLLLVELALGDVSRKRGNTGGLAGGIPEQRNVLMHPNYLATLASVAVDDLEGCCLPR